MTIAFASGLLSASLGLVAGVGGEVAVWLFLAGFSQRPRDAGSLQPVRLPVAEEVVLKLISATAVAMTMILVLLLFPVVTGIGLSTLAFGVSGSVGFAGVFVYFLSRRSQRMPITVDASGGNAKQK